MAPNRDKTENLLILGTLFFKFSSESTRQTTLKIEEWGSSYVGSRDYDESKIEFQKWKTSILMVITLSNQIYLSPLHSS